ncbi:MAG: MFS transporter [Bacteroidetes bacterium]|nr:MFS transporter [Bacteroidota bacterium]
MAKFLNECDKPTKQHYHILLLSWAGWVFDFYDLILYSFLMIQIKAELHFSDVEISFVFGASLAATAVGGIIFGYLSDRYGRKNVLQWTIITYSVGTFLSGFSYSIPMLLIFRIITGLGVGGEWGTGQTYIGETFPAKLRGRYGAFMQTGAPVGIALATLIGGYLAPEIGWRLCFLASVLPAVIVIFIRKKLPESDIWEERKRMILAGEISKEEIAKEKKNKFLALFEKENRKYFVLALVLAVFDMSAYWFTYSWMPGYLHQQRQFTMAKSALFMLFTQTGGFLGYFTFGFIADKFGRRPAYSVYSVIMAFGLLMITTFWNIIEVQQYLILVCMFLVGFGTGMFGGYGPLFSELFPTKIRGTAMGTAFNLARGVQFFTPVIIAIVATNYGLGGGISIAVVFALLTGAWIWTFPETRGKKMTVLHFEE